VPCHPAERELDSSQQAEGSGRKASFGGNGSGVGEIRVGMEHGDEPEAHLPRQRFEDAVRVDRERHVRRPEEDHPGAARGQRFRERGISPGVLLGRTLLRSVVDGLASLAEALPFDLRSCDALEERFAVRLHGDSHPDSQRAGRD
jgi:hypothetical protein